VARSGASSSTARSWSRAWARKGIPARVRGAGLQQIRGFGEYGFPESHAASFALIAYVTAWLKCHHHASTSPARCSTPAHGLLRTRRRSSTTPSATASRSAPSTYQASDHSTRGHPLGPLREHLRRRRWLDARGVANGRDGARVEYVGLVICRQRPYTAAGVTFMTLEDETGFVNLVVWSQVFERHTVVVRTAHLLGVTGTLQIQEGVVHLIAESLWLPELPAAIAAAPSRDFH
jgi:DNA polymerase III alpha subunit